MNEQAADRCHDYSSELIESAREVIEIESQAIKALGKAIDSSFADACHLLLECTGKCVVVGIGKSGHIGGKIAATLASTGTPAFFVHPAEASHGDLGMITRNDVVLAVSYSGETREITMLFPLLKRLGVPIIAMTGYPESAMAHHSDVHLNISVEKEACPLGLAPTSSTTTALVMGDALAVALLRCRGFTQHDFAMSHPGGTLGRRLLLRLEDIMRTGEAIPRVSIGTKLSEALIEISGKGLGMTTVVDDADRLLGMFTDGDLRRAIDRGVDIHQTLIGSLMTVDCKTADPDMLAAEALRMMEDHQINAIAILHQQNRICGALNMHDLLRIGVL